MTDSSGAPTLTHEYDPWGNLLQGSSTGGYVYTGREWDPEITLYYLRARYYDPLTARFLTPDPSGFVAAPNFYSYGLGNPIKYTDPFGLDALTSDCNVRKCMCQLWKLAMYGHDERERAAWVVKAADTYECQRWQWSATANHEHWKGPFPSGLEGLVHTHANSKDPKPSQCGDLCDNGAAKKIQRPVYAISRDGVWKISATGKPERAEGRDWLKDFDMKTCECK